MLIGSKIPVASTFKAVVYVEICFFSPSWCFRSLMKGCLCIHFPHLEECRPSLTSVKPPAPLTFDLTALWSASEYSLASRCRAVVAKELAKWTTAEAAEQSPLKPEQIAALPDELKVPVLHHHHHLCTDDHLAHRSSSFSSWAVPFLWQTTIWSSSSHRNCVTSTSRSVSSLRTALWSY